MNNLLNEKGINIKTELHISLEEAFSGCVRKLQLASFYDRCEACCGIGSQSRICSKCNGVGKLLVTMNSIFGTSQIVQSCSKCHGTGRIVKLKNKCKACSGKGFVKKKKEVQVQVPAGIENGQLLRIGNMGLFGKDLEEENRGDLIVVISVDAHSVL